ncbi:MAG: acetyl-CoA carboxylase biotin carboxylase subunit [Bacteroidales bacterium]|nr:acetyl-CoA carboxylase biotin carboxylase subunit [Bacteroidales bacterium]
MNVIHKILIANRGEIAVRVIRSAKKLGIKVVAIYSQVDADSLHVTMADESWCIGEVELSDTYLNIPKIIDVALQTGCDAIHPGYGFLAENPLFVEACVEAGIIFIGPHPEAMKIMGNKIEARAFVKKIKIPMTDGVTGTKQELEKTAHKIGFPVLLKAAAGGGGKGMRIVYKESELAEAIEATSRQALAYFGDETVYIEKFVEEPRHIEIQILGDNFGNVIHLYERECSIQRRYQKIIEESPSPTLTPEIREKMGAAAVAIGKAIGYNNAGTIEFLVDKDLNYYFLEMNTRIQVEHPVTEMVTGIDLVEEQIHVAAGNKLRLQQKDIHQHGHAIECRIYAEDPANNFQPSPGRMTFYKEPEIPGIRIDTGITANTEIKSSFDPMICKLIVWGKDRHEASQIMLLALEDYIIHGIRTNITYLVKLLQSEAFISNTITTKFCDEHTAALTKEIINDKNEIPDHVPMIGYLMFTLKRNLKTIPGWFEKPNLWETVGYWRNLMNIRLQFEEMEVTVKVPGYAENNFLFEIRGKAFHSSPIAYSPNRIDFTVDHHNYIVWVSEDSENQAYVSCHGHIFRLKRHDILAESVFSSGFDMHGHDSNHVTSPMPGKVIRIQVKGGESVKKGDPLLIIEAMKMENLIVSPRDAVVKSVNVSVNERVETVTALVEFEETEI